MSDSRIIQYINHPEYDADAFVIAQLEHELRNACEQRDALLSALKGLLPYAKLVIHSTDSEHDRAKLNAAFAAISKATDGR